MKHTARSIVYLVRMSSRCTTTNDPLNSTRVVKVIRDPRLFNFVIMTLYGLSAIRWACAFKWADTCYWLSALAITATVTFGYKH
jgi:hypothetical protein